MAGQALHQRLWHYQRERFPILAHGLLIAVFSFSAISFSQFLQGRFALPHLETIFVSFISTFLFFLQLRLADEFKDYQEDFLYRPYRPVPRGLVSLYELGLVGVLSALIQLALALWLHIALVPFLLLTWGYLALMSKEFFRPDWLKAHPTIYMGSHMVILPLISLYATACDWQVNAGAPPTGLIWFLVVSFFNGLVIEIGRKIQAPQAEEVGVETYSALWGYRKASSTWLGMLLLTAAGALMAAYQVNFVKPVAWLLAILLFAASIMVWRFLKKPVTSRAKLIEPIAGLWTLLLYLSLGPIPLFMSFS